MSRLGGFGSFATIRLTSNAAQAARMVGFIDTVVESNCEDKLEESAKKLQKQMKEAIKGNQCELAPNGALTRILKGGSVPLVDTSQFVNGIRYKMLDKESVSFNKGGTNRFKAAFVGILRDSGITYPSSHLGVWRPISLYKLAKNQVVGYTVTLPGNKVKKKVPARDFRKAVWAQYGDEYKDLMKSAVSSAFSRLVR
jgi:hypothetical protein